MDKPQRRTTKTPVVTRDRCNNDNCINPFPSSYKLLICSHCKLLVYCGKTCQTEHWKSQHKYQCEDMREARRNNKTSKYDPIKSVANATGDDLNLQLNIVLGLAGRHEEKEEFEAAETILRQCIDELKPRRFSLLYSRLANVIGGQGNSRIDEAVAIMELSLQIEKEEENTEQQDAPLKVSSLRKYALLLRRQGAFEKALEIFEQTVQLDPEHHSDGLYHMGRIYFTLDQYYKAFLVFQRFVEALGPSTNAPEDEYAKNISAACHFIACWKFIRIQARIKRAATTGTTLSAAVHEEMDEIVGLGVRAHNLRPDDPQISQFIMECSVFFVEVRFQERGRG